MDPAALSALLVTLKVAGAATALVALPAIAAGHLMARRRFRGKSLVETLFLLPLVLPPTAVGYLLLEALGRDGPLGPEALGLDLLFTWQGGAIAAGVMAFPLVARTARVAFGEVDPRLEAMGRSLGLSRARVLATITLPLASRGLLAALVLGLGRALGEFGATILVAGAIPGSTRTLPAAIWEEIQLGHDDAALELVAITVVLAFAVVWTVELLLRGSRREERA